MAHYVMLDGMKTWVDGTRRPDPQPPAEMAPAPVLLATPDNTEPMTGDFMQPPTVAMMPLLGEAEITEAMHSIPTQTEGGQ